MRGIGTPGITRLIGNTPLLRVRLFERDFPNVEVYAKAEWFNPGGSVKDRAALAMIEDGERTGALTRDKTIIDSTSGNTGIAYALVGAAKGYRVTLVMPRNVSAERKALVTAFGAEIIYSEAGEASDGASVQVRGLVGRPFQRRRVVGGAQAGGDDSRGCCRHGVSRLGRSLPVDRPVRTTAVKIHRDALESIRSHGAEGYPHEICGIMIGPRGDGEVTEVKRARNIVVERARDRYEIDPRDHIRIQRDADAADLDLID